MFPTDDPNTHVQKPVGANAPPKPRKLNLRKYKEEQRKKDIPPLLPYKLNIPDEEDLVEKDETPLSLTLKIVFVVAVVSFFVWFSYSQDKQRRLECISKYGFFENPITAFGTCRTE